VPAFEAEIVIADHVDGIVFALPLVAVGVGKAVNVVSHVMICPSAMVYVSAAKFSLPP
jgi:hypothetical protein